MKKEQTIKYATIEIQKIREKDERGRGAIYNHLRWCVEIKMGNSTKSFCEVSLKRIFNGIKNEMFI